MKTQESFAHVGHNDSTSSWRISVSLHRAPHPKVTFETVRQHLSVKVPETLMRKGYDQAADMSVGCTLTFRVTCLYGKESEGTLSEDCCRHLTLTIRVGRYLRRCQGFESCLVRTPMHNSERRCAAQNGSRHREIVSV
jgi:hypothetical protein